MLFHRAFPVAHFILGRKNPGMMPLWPQRMESSEKSSITLNESTLLANACLVNPPAICTTLTLTEIVPGARRSAGITMEDVYRPFSIRSSRSTGIRVCRPEQLVTQSVDEQQGGLQIFAALKDNEFDFDAGRLRRQQVFDRTALRVHDPNGMQFDDLIARCRVQVCPFLEGRGPLSCSLVAGLLVAPDPLLLDDSLSDDELVDGASSEEVC